jgi:small subunit ribosomal protein S6
MQLYETGFLLSPSLSEEDTEKFISQMLEVISQKKGNLVKQDRWGKRRLAYPIKKAKEAFYVFLTYEGEPGIPAEMERRFKQTDSVLRYLTLRREAKESVRRKKKKSAEAEKKEAQETTPEQAPEARTAAPEESKSEVK